MNDDPHDSHNQRGTNPMGTPINESLVNEMCKQEYYQRLKSASLSQTRPATGAYRLSRPMTTRIQEPVFNRQNSAFKAKVAARQAFNHDEGILEKQVQQLKAAKQCGFESYFNYNMKMPTYAPVRPFLKINMSQLTVGKQLAVGYMDQARKTSPTKRTNYNVQVQNAEKILLVDQQKAKQGQPVDFMQRDLDDASAEIAYKMRYMQLQCAGYSPEMIRVGLSRNYKFKQVPPLWTEERHEVDEERLKTEYILKQQQLVAQRRSRWEVE